MGNAGEVTNSVCVPSQVLSFDLANLLLWSLWWSNAELKNSVQQALLNSGVILGGTAVTKSGRAYACLRGDVIMHGSHVQVSRVADQSATG